MNISETITFQTELEDKNLCFRNVTQEGRNKDIRTTYKMPSNITLRTCFEVSAYTPSFSSCNSIKEAKDFPAILDMLGEKSNGLYRFVVVSKL